MRLPLVIVAALATVFGFVQTTSAVWLDDTAHYMKHNYHQNVMWPWPYVCPDRIAVREPFALMVNNGWRRQNLLGAHHFNTNNDKLSTAGQLRVQWIMTQAPQNRREIFVERSLETDVTAKRLVAVREYAALVPADSGMPQISETFLVSEGRPASVVDNTNTRFQESAPVPVLPAATAMDTGQ